MIVSIGLFSIVMVVCITALLSVIDANRKAQAVQSVINNLNIAVDGMVRSIRQGSNYRCGSSSPSNPNCAGGGSAVYFEAYGGSTSTTGDDWVYAFATDENGIGRIYRSESGTLSDARPVTAPEVSIEDLEFYVLGATRGDGEQPKVMIVIKGTAGSEKATVQTTFHVQATAVQRILDI
jgi:type II secretory pathway pseudopilin PulG